MWSELITASVLLIMVIIDIILRVTELNSQVYNVDTEVKKILAEFSDQIFNEEQSSFLPNSSSPTKTKLGKSHSLPINKSLQTSGNQQS